VSGAVFAYDKTSCYYISSFFHAEAKPTGTVSYLIWSTIFDRTGQVFDFEGSIIKEVEFYFRSFGGKLTPHYRIYRVPNPLIRLGLNTFKPDFLG